MMSLTKTARHINRLLTMDTRVIERIIYYGIKQMLLVLWKYENSYRERGTDVNKRLLRLSAIRTTFPLTLP